MKTKNMEIKTMKFDPDRFARVAYCVIKANAERRQILGVFQKDEIAENSSRIILKVPSPYPYLFVSHKRIVFLRIVVQKNPKLPK